MYRAEPKKEKGVHRLPIFIFDTLSDLNKKGGYDTKQ